MKIIHEFYGRAQTTGTGNPYAFKITGPPPAFNGFQVELMAADCYGKGKSFKEGDALYLEGDGRSIKQMLKDLLNVVEIIEESCRERHDKTASETKRCSNCGFWFAGSHDCSYFKKNLRVRKAKKAR
jgi:hypothetical protein